MKKLMIVGAMAAASVAFGAEASYWAQVYDAALTMKTGVCKAGKATAATVKYYEAYLGTGNAPVEKGEEMGFRKQSSRKISGLFWGCECETIAFPAWRRYSPRPTAGGNGRFLGGYAFWDQAANTYFVLPNTVFGWGILNRINNDFKTVEGAWVLANNVNPQALYLMGAGFGKASVAARPCRSIISKMSGSFAGFRFPGTDDLTGTCIYCGIDDCNVRPFCEACFFWTSNTRLTAAYGTWSIKFNAKAAKKLAGKGRITQSYTFKKAGNLAEVLAWMEVFVDWLDQNGADTDEDEDAADRLMDPDTVKSVYYYGAAKAAGYNVSEEDALDAGEEDYLALLGYSPIDEADLEGEDLECDECAENSAEASVFPSVVDLIDGVVNGDAGSEEDES